MCACVWMCARNGHKKHLHWMDCITSFSSTFIFFKWAVLKQGKEKNPSLAGKCIQWLYDAFCKEMDFLTKFHRHFGLKCRPVERHTTLKIRIFLVIFIPTQKDAPPNPSLFLYDPNRCVLISCTPWVNYFVLLWSSLTSNKWIKQTSVGVARFCSKYQFYTSTMWPQGGSREWVDASSCGTTFAILCYCALHFFKWTNVVSLWSIKQLFLVYQLAAVSNFT